MTTLQPSSVRLCSTDIPKEYLDLVCDAAVVAWDIETSGLDWRTERIATCQLYVPDNLAVIVRINDTPPMRLQSLLSNPSISKIFHHAMFDLRFMAYNWEVVPQNIACTKIAAKLLDEENKNSLQGLLERYLGITIDKTERTSDWLSPKLTEKQVAYAVTDVLYLPALLRVLEDELESKGLLNLAHACFAHIPTKVQLDTLGYKDIYGY